MANLPTTSDAGAVLEQVVIHGDLSKLSPAERVAYYKAVCESVGLNPLTKPFDYIVLNGKLTLYARRDAAEQLRRIHGISVTKLERDYQGDLYVVTAYGQDRTGRVDAATGAVSIAGLKGEQLANALMKAETKAKRRLTLSLAGLGWLDETETDSIPDAIKPPTVEVDGVIDVAEQPQQQAEPHCTKADYERLVQTAEAHGWSRADVNGYLIKRGYRSIKQVPTSALAEAMEYFSQPRNTEEGTSDAEPAGAGGDQADGSGA